MITAALIDNREPEWVQKLTFGGKPTMTAMLDAGDIHVTTDDDCILMIERKTPDDFLNSLKDERLFPQMARLVQPRLDELANGVRESSWPYLVITGLFTCDRNGKVVTDNRQTEWGWNSVAGALLSIQEMGVFISQCNGDENFEGSVIRLSERRRDEVHKVLPARPPMIMGPDVAMLCNLPGIGLERAQMILNYTGGNLNQAITALTDLSCRIPGVGQSIQRSVKRLFRLEENEILISFMKEN